MTIIKLRRGLAALWTSVNPILSEGEMGVEMDTRKFKFGDGTKRWLDLQYAGDTSELSIEIAARVAGDDALDVRLDALEAASSGFGGGGNLISAGTQLAPAGSTVLFSNANGVTFGLSNSSVLTASVAAGLPSPVNFSAGLASADLGSVVFSNSNGVSFGLNGSTITAAHNGLTSQSNQAFSADASSTFQTLTFQNSNGVSFSNNAGALRVTHDLMFSTSRPAFSADASSTFQTLSFQNSNQISFSNNAGAIRITHDLMQSTSRPAFSAGAASSTFQTLQFQDSLNLSFSNNAGSIRITHNLAGTSTGFAGANISGSVTHNSSGINLSLSVAAPGAGAENNWFNLLGANTAGNTTASGSTIGLSGLGVTLSGTNNSVIVVSGGGGAAGFTAAGYHPYDDLMQVVGQAGQGSLQIDPQIFPNVIFDRIGFSVQNTNSSNSSGSHTISLWVGLYTRNDSSLSLYTSFSGSKAVTHSGTAGSYSWYSGGRNLTFSLAAATTITAAKYWIAALSRTTSGGANGTYSNFMVSNINSTNSGLFGTATNATIQPKLGQGMYSATTSAMPASIAFSQINGNSSAFRRMPVIGFHSGTA